MTTAEQKTVDSLLKLVSDLRTENIKFREDIKLHVESINSKVEKKHMPSYYENDILTIAQQSIQKSIEASLVGYGSPLNKLVVSVIDENSKELRQIISDSFTTVIKQDEFKKSIISAFSHKVAKTIISNNDGLFDKVSNELKQDIQFKTKMQSAVINVVDECLNTQTKS